MQKYSILLSMLALLLSAGCTHLPMATAVAKQKQAQAKSAADLFLDRQIRQLCNYPTIGSVERRYGKRPVKLRQYQDYCNHRQGDINNAP